MTLTAIRKLYYLLLLSFMLSPVSSSQQPVKDRVIDTVRCASQKDQSYALYLPPQYEGAKEWPLIMIFDPSARGRFATDLFRDAGKKYGYIIACSNNSRNGPLENNYAAASAMIQDLQKRFRIDDRRIFLAGFSGGSRFAMALASTGKGFAGVIGCGAGLPNDNTMMPGANSDFLYYGLTGVRDMNYIEMHELVPFFTSRTKIVGFIRSFNGGHEWPDATLLTDAVMWMTIQQMNRKIIPENKDFIVGVKNRILLVINSEESSGNQAEAVNYMRLAVRDFKDTQYAAEIMKMLSDAERSSSYTDAVRIWNRTAAAEQEKKEKYLNYLSSILYSSEFPDTAIRWWKTETVSLVRQRDRSSVSSSQMASRLLNFISILCSEQGTSFYRNKMYMQASGMFSICTLSDSENPMNYFNLARSEVALGNTKEAIDALTAAVNHGFSSRKSVESDHVFDRLKTNERFKALILKLQ